MHELVFSKHDAPLVDSKSVLVVERDATYINRIAHVMEARGFEVTCVESEGEALQLIRIAPPAFAIIDLRPGRPCGLEIVAALASRRPTSRAIVVSAYDSLAAAVLAIKLGAVDYLAKPVDANDVCGILLGSTPEDTTGNCEFMSSRRVKWEHVHRVYELCDRNVSETARRLAIHRRSLQRLLSKRAPR